MQDALCSYHSNAGCFKLLLCMVPRGSSCVQVAKSCLQPFLLLMLHLLRLFGSCLQVGSCRFFCASESDFKNKRNDSSKCGWAHVTDMCRAWDLFLFHARDALVKSPADILTVEDIYCRCLTVITDAIARNWFSTANKNAGKLWLSLAQSCRAGDECFHAHAMVP